MALVALPTHPEECCASCPEWLPRQWGDTAMLQRLLEAANTLRENGGIQERTREAFREAFTIHMQQNDAIHLAFSAALPLFFEALRPGDGGGHGASCGRGQLVFKRDHASDNIAACIELLEMLQSLSRFGDRPPSDSFPPDAPQDAPQDGAKCPKWQYVRELCSQAALSLDIVRLVYLAKHARRSRLHPNKSQPSLGDVQEALVHTPDAADRRVASTQLVQDADGSRPEPTELQNSQGIIPSGPAGSGDGILIPSDEEYSRTRQNSLVRAGRFLKALQGPMDQLKGERESSQSDLVMKNLLFPAFTKFVEQQLLPLYVRDLTIATLSEAWWSYQSSL